MMNAYEDWIVEYTQHCSGLLGRCKEAVQKMKEAFPELEIKRGHAYTDWGERGHWWCVAPDGQIVDPTKAQFPFGLVYEYVEFNPEMRVRIGTCADCGDAITARLDENDQPREEDYYDQMFCSERCSQTYLAYLNECRF